jgi:hypothetical protein
MFAHCVYCPSVLVCESADEAETWAAAHERRAGKHSVKVEGYEQHSGGIGVKA